MTQPRDEHDKQRPRGQRPIDPMFDGHLQKPFDKMTVAERLDWLTEAALLLHAGRRARGVADSHHASGPGAE